MSAEPDKLPDDMLSLDRVQKELAGRGFENVKVIPGSSYRENSTIIIVPTRKTGVTPEGRLVGGIHPKVLSRWMGLMAPMNQKRGGPIFVEGHEVGVAYNEAIKNILADPNLGKWKYVMTLEDDNLPPPDAHIRLLESIEAGPFDAVSGLYFTKGLYTMPMAYGDPDEFARTGVLEFRPRDVRKALSEGTVMRVNGIAMGCALWRMNLFREIPPPWFVTLADVIPDKGPVAFTQDLYFCERAVRAGKRFGVDMRVKVGHLDMTTGDVY